MALKISSIGNKNQLSDERIGFEAKSKCNLKNFFIFSTNFNDGGFYNRSKSAYWFAPRELNAGDKVVLYTKSGVDSSKDSDDGTKIYFYYWGLSETIYKDSKHGVVLGSIDNWELSKKF